MVQGVNDAPAWQLEFIFGEMIARKFGMFGRLYHRRFQHYIYRDAASTSRTLVYSLPLTLEGLENWGMSGLPVLELSILGMLMRPELRRFDAEYRALVRRARTSAEPAFQAVFELLERHGVEHGEITVAWNNRSHPRIADARQVACQINVLRPLSPAVLEAALQAASESVRGRCELAWSALSTFDLETLRVERLTHVPVSESGSHFARSA